VRIHWSFGAAVVLALAWAFPASADTPVKMADLPAAVQKTVKEQSQGATIRGLSKEVEKGKTTYEAELRVNGHNKDITIDETGTVIEVEEEVPIASVPAAAKEAIEKAAGKGKVLKVETVTHGNTLVAYEAVVQKTPGGKKSEVRVDPQGKPAPEQ